MGIYVNRNLSIVEGQWENGIKNALESLKRDLMKACLQTDQAGTCLYLEKVEMAPELFIIEIHEEGIYLKASDSLGFIYGVYRISREIFGIHEFWFWNDQVIEGKESYYLEVGQRWVRKPSSIRYRGWFVNDEVLLHTWMLERRKDRPWEMVFETLLRCEGNMVIPGTDKNSRKYTKLALDMGLYVTQHHAEPLGAEMFSRAYPDLEASYDLYPDLFQTLWKQAILQHKNEKIIWSIGFRGQGDCPFWENDPRYNTDASRGSLMGKIMRLQYDMVKENNPQAVICTNLYGEVLELYRKGFLELPEDVIKIWSDNGYGKMVTRRQGNHNPRVNSLPDLKEKGPHGMYYHVSFYDLQAANHITMLPNKAEFVYSELKKAMQYGIKSFWIINSSNIKPHVYYLDMLRQLWNDGDFDVNEHQRQYIEKYYGKEALPMVKTCMDMYYDSAISFGSHEDEHAGEQFVNHIPRGLASQFMRDENSPDIELRWATGEKSLWGQVGYFFDLFDRGFKRYSKAFRQCEITAANLSEPSRQLFIDSIWLQTGIYKNSYEGAKLLCQGLEYAHQKDWEHAFYAIGCARESYLQAYDLLKGVEHGKWHGFYENECLTDLRQSGYLMKVLMGYLRNFGDGPSYYKWKRKFLYSQEDSKVTLVLHMENHVSDDEMFDLMKEKWHK